ncbi:MAG TPA: HDOD domain-containing protein, partial [Desulfurivibrionaceae bacterium]|nr:HDOD domain-containing protein [Desulfurivibrionaceae bacterium]
VILKDFSLTNKVLQVVNSAYYSRGVPVTTIERAVTTLGIRVIGELAVTVSLIEEFLKAGVEKEGISKILTISFLSAHLSKTIAQRKRLPVSPEEAYICTLLHDLGRVVIFIYLPHVYRRIEMAEEGGSSEENMARLMLKGLSFAEVGMEIARFWNFSETIINAMAPAPGPLERGAPADLLLQHLAVFSNRYTRNIAARQHPAWLLAEYGDHFGLDCQEPLGILLKTSETATGVSEIIRHGMTRLKMRSRVLCAMNSCRKLAAA